MILDPAATNHQWERSKNLAHYFSIIRAFYKCPASLNGCFNNKYVRVIYSETLLPSPYLQLLVTQHGFRLMVFAHDLCLLAYEQLAASLSKIFRPAGMSTRRWLHSTLQMVHVY